MAFTYGTEMQDRIAGVVLNRTYAELPAYQKTVLDNTTTTPTGGVAKTVLVRLQNESQWLTLAGVSTLPDAAEQYFHAEACYEFAKALRHDLTQMFRIGRNDARESYVNSFSRKEMTAYDTEYSDLTLQAARYHTISWLARQNPPIHVPISDVDAAAIWICDWVWNKARWSFRREQANFTVATNGTVTFNGATGTFAEFATRKLYYGPSLTGNYVRWASSDEMAQAKAAIADSSTPTGAPRMFRFEDHSGTKVWSWYPMPDQTYTLYFEMLTAGPGRPSSASDATVFAKFPTIFKPIIKDLIRAKVVRDSGHRAGPDMWYDATNALDLMLPQYDEPGDVVRPSTVTDIYHDVQDLTGCNQLGGGGM